MKDNVVLCSIIALVIIAVVLALNMGCYSSPAQCKATFALVYVDRRMLPVETATDAPKQAVLASDGRGYGNNGRAFIEQGMVVYASPMTSQSNSTPVSIEVPLLK